MDSRVSSPRWNWLGRRRRVEDREVPVEPVTPPLRQPALFPTTPSGSPLVSPTNALGVADVFSCTPRAGIDCRHGRALIFDAENGRDLLRRRLRAAGIKDGVGITLVDGLDIVKDAGWFEETIRQAQANLVVVDSLRMLTFGRDEDDSGAMEAPMSALRRMARDTGAAIVVVHHRRKGTADFRGSSVIGDQTDMLFALGREKGDPEQRTRRKLHTAKCRIDEEPRPRWLAIVADRARGLVTVDLAEPYETEDAPRPRDEHRDRVLAALDRTPRSGRRIAADVGLPEATTRRLLHDFESESLAEKQPGGWVRHRVTSLGGDAPDALDDLGPEQPSPDDRLAEAKPSPVCRCDRPLPAPDEHGEVRCTKCSHRVGRTP